MTWLALLAVAHAEPIVIEGSLDEAPAEPFLFLPFTVPEGTAELRFAHDDGSDANVLDWGLFGPDGFRGWHGSNGSAAVVGELAASDGYVPGPLAGDWEVIVGFPQVSELPVRWRVEITLADTASLPPDPDVGPYEPPAPIRTEPGWYAGDFHVHTVQSGDASPTMDAAVEEAERRGLDFVELSEHDTTAHLARLAAVQARHPGVLVLPGVEWTTYLGHANAIGVTGYVPFHVGTRGLTAQDAVDAVHDQGGLFAPNHPSLDLGNLCHGCAWRHDVAGETLDALEVQTVSADVLGPLFQQSTLALWEALLDEGGHVAAIGGSDDHSGGHPTGSFSSALGTPRTYVWAEELSVRGILDGLRAGRTVVKLGGPDDPWVELEPSRRRSGDTVTAEHDVAVTVRVEGGAGSVLEVVQDGEVVRTAPVDADPFEVTWTVPVGPGEPAHRVRAQVTRDGVVRTLTSHLWVRRTTAFHDPPVETCGCDAAGASGGATSAAALAWLLALRRRRRPGCSLR